VFRLPPADLFKLHGPERAMPGLPMITVKLLPAPSRPDYPLDVARCVEWLYSGRAPRRQASHPVVIHSLAERGGVMFVSNDRTYSSIEILELIDEQGRFRTSKDPRPMRVTRLQKPKGN
jgi:hypothetical protein